MILIQQAKLHDLIKSTMGHFFSVHFIKKDGTHRVLNGRIGVHSHMKNEIKKHRQSLTNDFTQPYVCVFDVKNNGYRNVNLNTIQSIRYGGNEYFTS